MQGPLRFLPCGDLAGRGGRVALRGVFQRTDAAVQIADALGICNANYFCQIFKEDTGLTPSDYRRNCYEKENTKPSVL